METAQHLELTSKKEGQDAEGRNQEDGGRQRRQSVHCWMVTGRCAHLSVRLWRSTAALKPGLASGPPPSPAAAAAACPRSFQRACRAHLRVAAAGGLRALPARMKVACRHTSASTQESASFPERRRQADTESKSHWIVQRMALAKRLDLHGREILQQGPCMQAGGAKEERMQRACARTCRRGARGRRQRWRAGRRARGG